MTAHEGYVWFLPSWYSDDWWDVDYYNSAPSHGDNRPQEHIPCNTENMEYAIDGHFLLQKTFSDPETTKVIGGIKIRDYKMQYAQRVGKAVIHFTVFYLTIPLKVMYNSYILKAMFLFFTNSQFLETVIRLIG